MLARTRDSTVIEECARDINVFAAACGMRPTFQQQQLLDAVQEGIHSGEGARIAVKSGRGPGKTTASGICGLWLLISAPYTKLVITAPTMRLCRDIWLAEVKQTLRRADSRIARLFNVTGTGIGVCGHKQNEWGCSLVTATTTEAASGHHRENMHIIAEEASGIPPEMINVFKATLSNPNAVFVQIGNPTSRDSDFYNCFTTQSHIWKGFTWNAEETPASTWFDPRRNREQEDEFGRDSDPYRINVLGEFPSTDPNCVMGPEDVLACMDKSRFAVAMSLSKARQIGMDFARFGGDENTIFRRYGNAIVEHWWAARVDPNTAVDKAFRMQIEAGWKDQDCKYVADAGGIGQGVMGNFHRAGKKIHEFHNNGKSNKNDYANKITQAWFHLGKLVKERKCYIPKDNVLLRQLTTRQYFTDNKGRLILESKDDYMRRGHESPDRADGLVLAFYDDGIAGTWVSSAQGASKRVGI